MLIVRLQGKLIWEMFFVCKLNLEVGDHGAGVKARPCDAPQENR